MAKGGDVVELTFDHDDLGSGRVYFKANEDSTFNPGGYRSDDADDGVDGSGEMIDVMTRRRWSVEGTVAWDDNGRGDLDKIIALASSPKQATFTVSRISGSVYKGKGKPVGPYDAAGKAATFSLKISGGGLLEQIAGN